jgi:hypothetical protein
MERGTDATGYATLNKSGLIVGTARALPADRFCSSNAFALAKSAKTAILHTRFATQGSPKNPLNNHPLYSYDTEGNAVALVHNGCIDNDFSLFRNLGLYRCAEVDSEILPAMLAATSSEDYPDIFGQVEGSVAAAWYDEREPETLFVARSCSSPVEFVVIDTERDGRPLKGIVFASTPRMLRMALESLGLAFNSPGVEHFYLTEGQALRITAGTYSGYAETFTPGKRRSYRTWQSSGLGSKSNSTTTSKHRSAGESRYRVSPWLGGEVDEDLDAQIAAWAGGTYPDNDDDTDTSGSDSDTAGATGCGDDHRCAYEASELAALTEAEFDTFIEHMEFCDPDSCTMQSGATCPVVREGRTPTLWEIEAVTNAYLNACDQTISESTDIPTETEPQCSTDEGEIIDAEIVTDYPEPTKHPRITSEDLPLTVHTVEPRWQGAVL